MKLLAITWAGGGNVHPMVALAVELLARGHRVRVFGPSALESRFTAEGLDFVAQPSGQEWGRGLADAVAAELEREPVDVALVDYMQPEAMSAVELSGTPMAALVHTLYARVAAGPTSPMNMSGGLDRINALREELGLEPLAAITDLLGMAGRVIVAAPEALDRPDGRVPENVRYAGPLVEAPGPDEGWQSPGTPMVHACTSTVAPPDVATAVLQRILDATADLAVTMFMTATDEVRSALTVPANAVVTGYVRHSAVLPHAELFVTHAGLGSVGVALACGVPMVCLPLFHEQPDNAAHAEALGVARTLANDAAVADLRKAIEAALADEGMRTAARSMSAAIRAAGHPPSIAATALEELL